MADLLYTGDRILIGALAAVGLLFAFGLGIAGAFLAVVVQRAVQAFRRRRQIRRSLRQLEAHANHPAFDQLRNAIREAREEKP